MHYDDGMDTQPGEDLKLGDQDLGPATYDVDGDGVADSYIHVVGDDEVEVLTDSDGDGQVDTAYEIDGDGSVTELQGQDGQVVTVGTGHLDDSGRIQMDGSGPTTPGDGDPVPGTDTNHPDGDLIMQDGGSSVDVGAPTIDLTGDGVNDTVQLTGTDGSTVLVADADQDGQADNIVQISPDGSVTYAVSDGHGGWVVSGTGHMDADGTLTQDSSGETGQPYQPPVDLGSGTGTDDGTATQVSTHSGADMTVDIDGTAYDVGPATADTDGDGTADTAVVEGSDGSTVFVTDVDGDGTGDQIVQVNPDGSVVVQQGDGDGNWQTVATGHLDANGQVVIDQQAGTDAGTSTGTAGTAGTSATDGNSGTAGTDGTETTGTQTASSGSDLTVDIDGTSYDVGAPTLDADGNGTPDTAVVQGDDGTTVLVTDVDGDGTGDQMVQINPDGSAQIQQTDGNGGWQTVATGHVDSSGTLVIDQQ